MNSELIILMEKLQAIEAELDKKDRTSKREVRGYLKDAKALILKIMKNQAEG